MKAENNDDKTKLMETCKISITFVDLFKLKEKPTSWNHFNIWWGMGSKIKFNNFDWNENKKSNFQKSVTKILISTDSLESEGNLQVVEWNLK